MKKKIYKLFKWATKSEWNENFIVPLYLKFLFWINLYIVICSLFPKCYFLKILGIVMLMIIFFGKKLLIKYGTKFGKELGELK